MQALQILRIFALHKPQTTTQQPFNMNILVVRMRQMGDAILATALLNTLRRNFPDANIDFVLNSRIAPLFDGHPSIDHLITFTDEERHNTRIYIRKVWNVVHNTHYDAIIDMRSTFNTMLFAMLSPSTPYRIGLNKPYTWLAFNHRVARNKQKRSIVEHDISFALPLCPTGKLEEVREFSLHISNEELSEYGTYLHQMGIDTTRPLLLANVTAKLPGKVWAEERMTDVLSRFVKHYPHWQIIFNYAPGAEEANARRIYTRMGCPPQVKIEVQARSPRQLVALGHYATLFFGNEGGARHIMQAAGCPTLVVCAPENDKRVWIPQTNVEARGIAAADFMTSAQLQTMDRNEQYALITADAVWAELDQMTQRINR